MAEDLGETYRKLRIKVRNQTSSLKDMRKKFVSKSNEVIGKTSDFRNNVRKLRQEYQNNFGGFDYAMKEWLAKCDKIKAQQTELDAAKAAGDSKKAQDIEKAMQANHKAAEGFRKVIEAAAGKGPDYEKKLKDLEALADALNKTKSV